MSVFKAYDVRGLVPEELTPGLCRAIGAAFVDQMECASVVVGRDARPSSQALCAAFAEGCTLRGADVVDIGLCSTDSVYYASGAWNVPVAMFTASHNPAQYNGIKFCRPGARGIGYTTGLSDIESRAKEYLANIPPAEREGVVFTKNALPEYADYLRCLVGPLRRPLKVVVDAGNGMAGKVVPVVMQSDDIDIEIVPLYFELDGTFPNHDANPLDPRNLVDLQRKVRETSADLGLAFDGDADRCIVVDETANPVTPSAVASIVAKRLLRQTGNSRAILVHNLLVSRSFAETAYAANRENQLIRTRVGHSLIKDVMHQTRALFGCEHSAHYYFGDFWGADNGMLAALYLMAELCESDLSMSALSQRYTPYFQSGEINHRVLRPDDIINQIHRAFPGAAFDFLDGITLSGSVVVDRSAGSPSYLMHEANDVTSGNSSETDLGNSSSGFEGISTDSGSVASDVSGGDHSTALGSTSVYFWWLNIRESNTEPLLRLNVEAEAQDLMESIRDRALSIIRQQSQPSVSRQ